MKVLDNQQEGLQRPIGRVNRTRYHGRLINKLGMTLAFVLTFAVVLCSFLNYFKFQENYRQLILDRLNIVIAEAVYNIEYGLGLGLHLGELDQVTQTLTRVSQRDDQVSAILVIDRVGDVLHMEGSTSKAQAALTTWLIDWEGSAENQFAEQDQSFIFSQGLHNSFGQAEGFLLLIYEKDDFNQVLQKVQKRLFQAALLVIFLATLIGLVVVYLLLRPTLHSLHRMLDSLLQLEAGQPSNLRANNAHGLIEAELVELERVCQGDATPHAVDTKGKKEGARGAFVILATTILLIIVATIASAWYQLEIFKAELLPQEAKKALVIADQVSGKIDYLLANGVPFNRIQGLDLTYVPIQDSHPDVEFIGVLQGDGSLIHSRAQGSEAFSSISQLSSRYNLYQTAIKQDDRVIAGVVVGIDPAVMANSLREIILDIAAILVVSSLLATELILFIVSYTLTTPLLTLKSVIEQGVKGEFNVGMRVLFRDEVGRLGEKLNHLLDGARRKVIATGERLPDPTYLTSVSVNFVRPPLFLLVFSESMSLSFFPSFVESMYEPIANLSKSMIIGLPISVFMAIWALSLPFAGQWSDVVGRRRAFMVGSVITAIGLFSTGLATDLWFLLGARCFTAVGYGLVFITAQGFVTDNTQAHNRTKGMATFLSGFFSGSLCGAAIGGILSDRIGFSMTFFLSAILSLASAMFVAQFFAKNDDSGDKPAGTKLAWSDFKVLWKNPYFLIITFFSAIPAKATLTGFLYYSAPMFMKDQLDVSQSSAGRVLMAYGLAIVVISPLSAWLVDYFKRKRTFIALGGLMSGGALCSLYLLPNEQGMLLSVLLLGIAHAIGISPQIALLTELIEGKVDVSMGKIIGIFRMTERIGNIAGPLVAAVLITVVGYTDAFLWFSGFLMMNVFIMLLLLAVASRFERNSLNKAAARVEVLS